MDPHAVRTDPGPLTCDPIQPKPRRLRQQALSSRRSAAPGSHLPTGRPSYGFECDRRTRLRFFVESGLTRRLRVRSRDGAICCLRFGDGEHLAGLVGAPFGGGAASKVGAGSKVGANGSGAVAVRSGAAVGSREVQLSLNPTSKVGANSWVRLCRFTETVGADSVSRDGLAQMVSRPTPCSPPAPSAPAPRRAEPHPEGFGEPPNPE